MIPIDEPVRWLSREERREKETNRWHRAWHVQEWLRNQPWLRERQWDRQLGRLLVRCDRRMSAAAASRIYADKTFDVTQPSRVRQVFQ